MVPVLCASSRWDTTFPRQMVSFLQRTIRFTSLRRNVDLQNRHPLFQSGTLCGLTNHQLGVLMGNRLPILLVVEIMHPTHLLVSKHRIGLSRMVL